nr:LOW QUALITY PROTEIN: calcium-activated chloride channel regulator 3A-1-like [Cherax quadricarinatus]
MELLLKWLFVLVLSVSYSWSSRVVLTDQGYQGVVVALDEGLPLTICQQVLEGLQDVLSAASRVVFTGTRGRANFHSVTVLVPPSWSPTGCPLISGLQNATSETWQGAEMRVTQGRHPQHGTRPWTLQTRGCGHLGDYISMGYEFLLQNNTGITANNRFCTLFRNIEGRLQESDLTVKYVRARLPRIVLLIEDTSVMIVQKRWDFMRKAVRKLVTYDVPDGYSVGLVVFDSIAATKYPLTTLTDGATREKVGSSLPRNPSQEGEHKRCIVCGLREALRLLRQDGPGGHIVMVTGGSGSLAESEATEAMHMLSDSSVSLHAIIYPLTEKYPRPNAGLETLATRSGGHNFIVPDEGIGADSKLGMYYNLLDSLYHTLSAVAGRSVLPVKVHSAEHPGGKVPVSEGSFLVDPALGADTVFAIFYYDVAHVGNLIHLVSPQGQVIDTANMQKEDANINMITVRLAEAQVTPGLWQYKVGNRADSHQALYVQVTSRPRLRPGAPPVNARAWTSHSMGIVNASDISRPLALYTEVVAGVAGVESATVTATITRLGYTNNGTHHPPLKVNLFDNGLTGPDMMRGDGVYSRYVPWLVAGKYSVTVHVQGEVEGNKFVRHVRLGMVDVVGTPPVRDALPPARVVDLRAALLPNTVNQVGFTWTAPGGDLDYGTADRYVVMASQKQHDLSEGGGNLLEGWAAP